MSNNFKKMTRVVSWFMTLAIAMAFALPVDAIEFFSTPLRYQWVSQSGALSADGTAHEHYVNAGDTINMSLTIQNRSIDAAAKVMYGIPPGGTLLPEDEPYRGAHELRIGVKNDEILSWIDSSSFLINPDGANNRFAVYDGADADYGENLTFTWDLKIADDAIDGTYDLYTGLVREFDAWARQVNASGALLGSEDIFWRIVIGEGTVAGGGDLNIGIAGDTPASAHVAILSADIPMARISFTAGSSANALISGIAVRKTGLSEDTDIADIKLYDGATKLGSTQGVNSTSHKATFTGLSWLIPAGTTKTLTIKGTASSTSTVGDIMAVGIQAAADVTLSGSGTIAGTFPAYGNEFTVGSTSVGYLGVTAPTSPADNAGMISGSTEQDLASFKFLASSTEAFDVNSITLTEIGTSVDSDVLNMKLTYLGNQVGTTVTSLSDGKVTFTGSPLFTVKAGVSKTIYVVGDVAEGITSARTIRFEINDTPDVIAVGQISNGIVTIDKDAAGTTYEVAQGNTMTIAQGSISIIIDPTNLTAQEYIIGEEQVELSKFKFSAGSNEGVKITKIIFNEDGHAVSTDYQNARLYIDDSETPLATGGSVSTTTITFEDGNGLFVIPKSGNTVVTLKVDVSTNAAADDTFRVGIGAADNAYTNIVMYGAVSNEKIDSDSTHITAMTAVDDGDMNTHTIAVAGSFVVSAGPNTPALGNFALGTDDFEFVQFRMQAISEAARVTAVTVRFFDNDAVAGDDYGVNEVGTGDVTNAELYWLDGTTWTMLDDVSSPTSGVATFTFDHTVPKNTTETFKVVADIPTGASLTYLFTGISGSEDETLDIWDDVTATGVSSSATLNSGEMTGSSDSSVFTKAVPELTVVGSTVPAAHSIVLNATDILLGKFFLTANDVEDIKISTIKIYADEDADNMTSDSAAAEDFSNIYLRFDDGGTWRTTNPEGMTAGTPDEVTFSGSNFNLPNEWVAPKGGSIIVEIRGDLVATTAATMCFGMTDSSDGVANVVAAGLSSGTTATIFDHQNNAYDQILECPELTLDDAGALAIVAATDTPTAQQVTASYGSTVIAPTFTRIKLSATKEDIKVDALRVTTNADAQDDVFSSAVGAIKIYEGGTMSDNVLSGGTLVGSGTLVTVDSNPDAVDIVFDTVVTVPKDGSKFLTITAELNSIANGADSVADVPKLGVDQNIGTGIWDSTYSDSNDLNIRATGVQSGTRINTASTGSADLLGNAAIVVKTQLGMAVHSSSPSGTSTRHADHTIFKLAMTNTSTNQDALFRAGISQYTATVHSASVGSWTKIGTNSVVSAEETNYVTDAGCVGVLTHTTAAENDGMYWNADVDTDLSDYERVSFWFRTDQAVTTAGDIVFEIDDSSALGSPLISLDIPKLNADTWWRGDFALGAGISATAQFWGVTLDAANPTVYNSTNLYLDNIVFYTDSLKVNLSSNAGLFNTTGATGQSVTLKDGSTTLATGYVSGTGTDTQLSTSTAEVTFIPTTERAIPASGKTYDIISDTTTLMTATSVDITMNVGLGSSSTAGAITAGDVLWNDNSYTETIGWVDDVATSLVRSLNF